MNILHGRITKEMVASRLCVSLSTVGRWVDEGKLSPIRIGKRVLFNESEIDRIVESGFDANPPENKKEGRHA